MSRGLFLNSILAVAISVLALAGPAPVAAEETAATSNAPNSAVRGMPTLDDYLRESEVRSLALSPDGTRLALVKRVAEDTYRLAVLDTTDGFKVVAVHAEPEGQRFVGVRWVSGDRLAITLSGKKQLRGREWGYRRLMIISPDGSNPQGVFADRPQVLNNLDLTRIASRLPSDPDHILMVAFDGRQSLFKINIRNGTSEKVTSGSPRTVWFVVNKKGEPRLRIDFFYRSRRLPVFAYDIEKDRWKKVKTFHLNNLEEELDSYLATMEGDTTVLMLDRLEDDEYTKLYRYDILTDDYTGVAYEIDGYDVWDTVSDRYTGDVLGVTYMKDRPVYHYFDPVIDGVQKKLEERLPNGQVSILHISLEKERYLVFYEEPWRRGVYLFYERSQDRLLEIADVAPQLQKSSTTSVDTIRYMALDETMIEGYLTFPAGRGNEALPLIVLPHGGPAARDWLGYDVFVQYWATRGYAVFQPNFRGSTGRGRTFEEAGNKEYGGKMISDIASGVKALIKAGRVDENRICSVGVSYGGYASLMLALEPDLLQCAVSINGPTDYTNRIKQVLKDADDKEERLEIREWYDAAVGNIDTEAALLNAQSPLQRVQEFDVPLLVIHAKDDGNVDYKNGQIFDKALKKAKKSYDYVELECGGHALNWCRATRKVLIQTEGFFAEHIGDASQKAAAAKVRANAEDDDD